MKTKRLPYDKWPAVERPIGTPKTIGPTCRWYVGAPPLVDKNTTEQKQDGLLSTNESRHIRINDRRHASGRRAFERRINGNSKGTIMKLSVASRLNVVELELDATQDVNPTYSDIVLAIGCGCDELADIWLNMVGGAK